MVFKRVAHFPSALGPTNYVCVLTADVLCSALADPSQFRSGSWFCCHCWLDSQLLTKMLVKQVIEFLFDRLILQFMRNVGRFTNWRVTLVQGPRQAPLCHSDLACGLPKPASL